MNNLPTYWPKSVSHLQDKYDDGASDHVVIAEVSDAPFNGYKGCRRVTTALLPIEVVDDVLRSPAGIGWEVESWGPKPCVSDGQAFDTRFWINGRKGKDERFQTVINSWKRHDREVVLPDNVMLMVYGLVPRYIGDGTVCWDDPHGPVYDVVHVKPHVNFNDKGNEPLAQVTMRRDYLEDYCSLKRCAAVATYYEERFSADDDTFDQVLKGREGAEFELPGRRLEMAVLNDEYYRAAPQFSRVWGCRLILKPKSRPVTDAKDPALVWPDDSAPMTLARSGFMDMSPTRRFENMRVSPNLVCRPRREASAMVGGGVLIVRTESAVITLVLSSKSYTRDALRMS